MGGDAYPTLLLPAHQSPVHPALSALYLPAHQSTLVSAGCIESRVQASTRIFDPEASSAVLSQRRDLKVWEVLARESRTGSNNPH